MTREQHLRRLALLCCHFLRNLAYYRSGWRNGKLVQQTDFWKTVNVNFLDICILEWYKLFGDKRGKHYWGKAVTEEQTFLAGLLNEVALTEEQFQTYVDELRAYRDKFIAHLDSDLKMNIPKLGTAQKAVSYLYEYLRQNEDKGDFFRGLPPSTASYITSCRSESEAVYESCYETQRKNNA